MKQAEGSVTAAVVAVNDVCSQNPPNVDHFRQIKCLRPQSRMHRAVPRGKWFDFKGKTVVHSFGLSMNEVTSLPSCGQLPIAPPSVAVNLQASPHLRYPC